MRIHSSIGGLRSAAQRCPAGQLAFSLVEVAVAVMIFGIVGISLFAGFGTGFMLVDSAREELRATQILLQKVEDIRLCTYSSLASFPISFTERYDPATGSTNGGTLYVGTITTNTATFIPDTAAYKTNVCLVTVSLNWTNSHFNQIHLRKRMMRTLVARYGIQNYIWGAGP